MKSWLKSTEMCKDVAIIVNIVYQPIIIDIYISDIIMIWYSISSEYILHELHSVTEIL